MHTWTEKIQARPWPSSARVYEVIGKEYRGSRVTQIELRFNPMKRNLNSELDLDHIIHAALRAWIGHAGVRRQGGAHLLSGARATTKLTPHRPGEGDQVPPIGAAWVFDRRDRDERAGARPRGLLHNTRPLRRAPAGLKTHGAHRPRRAGTGADGVIAVVERLEPHRIGHGTARPTTSRRCAPPGAEHRPRAVPHVDLQTKAVKDLEEFSTSSRRLRLRREDTLNTDGRYLFDRTCVTEVHLVEKNGIPRPSRWTSPWLAEHPPFTPKRGSRGNACTGCSSAVSSFPPEPRTRWGSRLRAGRGASSARAADGTCR